ncbi:hypothetical protein PENSPDRAFT_692766 [Peniophora sp. CONT]|nr:hypothetical protein PENSPDRAFT_692766 [Peniophora sp. CONT]
MDLTGAFNGVANGNPLRKDIVDILRSDVRCALSAFVWNLEAAPSGDNPLLGEKRLDPYVKSVWRLGFDAPSTVVLLQAAVFSLPASERQGVEVHRLWDAVREGLTTPGFMKSMNTALRSNGDLMDTAAGLACLQALVQEHEHRDDETRLSDSARSGWQAAFFTEPMLLGFSDALGRLASEPVRGEAAKDFVDDTISICRFTMQLLHFRLVALTREGMHNSHRIVPSMDGDRAMQLLARGAKLTANCFELTAGDEQLRDLAPDILATVEAAIGVYRVWTTYMEYAKHDRGASVAGRVADRMRMEAEKYIRLSHGGWQGTHATLVRCAALSPNDDRLAPVRTALASLCERWAKLDAVLGVQAPSGCFWWQCQAGKGAETLVCKGCGEVRYCSKDCQRKHWKVHKVHCRRVTARACRYDGEFIFESLGSQPWVCPSGSPCRKESKRLAEAFKKALTATRCSVASTRPSRPRRVCHAPGAVIVPVRRSMTATRYRTSRFRRDYNDWPFGADDDSEREKSIEESDQGYEGDNSDSNSEPEPDSEEEEEKEEPEIECITTYFDPRAMGDPRLRPRSMNTLRMTSAADLPTPGSPPRDEVGVNPGAGVKRKSDWTEEGPSKRSKH